jgi:phosphoenolpyruvate synthase/pyruvate phosphate dikinase
MKGRSAISSRSTSRSFARERARPFPMEPAIQLWGAIEAVWRSWTLKKAVDYRRVNNIPETLGYRGQRRVDGLWESWR